MAKKDKITVQGTAIAIITQNDNDYISLTDMAKSKNPDDANGVIANWMRNRNTIEYLGIWECLYNPHFKPLEFEGFKMEAGTNAFTLSPQKWIERTNSIGIISKAGRYGSGTFAHKDIAFKFASWISVEFELFIAKDYQRLKEEETRTKSLEWNLQRTLSKINYHIHTSAISENLIPDTLTKEQINYVYASEADLLNVALFGLTAKQWREANPGAKGNIRDYATLEQLVVLSNMESINALLIQQQITQPDRLVQLNTTAITQMQALIGNKNIQNLI